MLGSLNSSIMRLVLPFLRLQPRWVCSHSLPAQLGGGRWSWQPTSRSVLENLWPYASWYCLDAQLALPVHLGQVILENRLGNIDGREHVGDQTDRQRDGKTANRPGSEQKQEEGGDHRRDVCIDNGEKGLIETRFDGRPRRLAISQFFADALEDQDVGIDSHTDG